MRTLISITQMLTMVFIGFIVGGLIIGSRSTWVTGIILLVCNVLLGMILQYFYDRSR
jgi:uncharacterized membrane protein YcaP (DUF421 family)